MKDVLTAASRLGLDGIRPRVLAEAETLVVHLAPHPVVARMPLTVSEDPAVTRPAAERLLNVARHLAAAGVPVVGACACVAPGPHRVGISWMTLWDFVEAVPLPEPSPAEALGLLDRLATGMGSFPGVLPRLAAWQRARPAFDALLADPSPLVASLLAARDWVDAWMEGEELVPAHGDAHRGNLLPGADGWRWLDFEDASLMPAWWDQASYAANLALFCGLGHAVVRALLDRQGTLGGRRAVLRGLAARSVFATAMNLVQALDGRGDMAFAQAQLERVGDFVAAVRLQAS